LNERWMTMKIQGSHPSINQYNKHMQQQPTKKKSTFNKDQLNISDAARQLQKNKTSDSKRSAYVHDIKQDVQSGEYKIEPEKIAKKIVDFWS